MLTTRNYDRFKIYTIDEVLPLIGSSATIIIDGLEVNVDSLRLKTFKYKGTDCVYCGIKGEFFALERHSSSTGKYHFNLYGIDKRKKERLMTKDHIHPKSMGGKDTLENMQPMCSSCNNKKGNKIPTEKRICFTCAFEPSDWKFGQTRKCGARPGIRLQKNENDEIKTYEYVQRVLIKTYVMKNCKSWKQKSSKKKKKESQSVRTCETLSNMCT